MSEAPNSLFFDRFSIVHAGVGAVLELAAIPAPLAMGGQVAFELVENDIKRWYGRFFPEDTPDGWQNMIGDVASFAAGYYGARVVKSSHEGRVALVGLAALAAGIWARDLTLHAWNRR